MTNTIVTTSVKVIGAPVTNKAANHAEKPEKFNGQNFKRWQQKMFFYLTTLNLSQFLMKTAPYMEPPKEGQPSNAQVQDLQVLLHEIHAEGMTLSETFQVEMSIEDLVVRLHIEEDNKLAQKNIYAPDSGKANMVKHDGSSSKSNTKGKGKDKRKNDKKIKRKVEYLAPKVRIVKQKAVDNGEKLYIGNSETTDIKGEGDVILNLTSKKELKLTNSDKFVLSKSQIKDEAIDKFVLYKTEVENQLGKKIKVVLSDGGGEYVSPYANLCAKHGIRHEFTAPCSPQQNGTAERKNRTLKEMVNAMLISSSLSQDIWGEANLTATYLLNKIPRKEKEETPYELWMGKKPSYQYLRV
ncbi:retrotransposon protein, putative, ty1-copia subclass [Tanacetum coccineum]